MRPDLTRRDAMKVAGAGLLAAPADRSSFAGEPKPKRGKRRIRSRITIRLADPTIVAWYNVVLRFSRIGSRGSLTSSPCLLVRFFVSCQAAHLRYPTEQCPKTQE